MYRNHPQIREAAIYARTDMQQLAREIIRMEGINTLHNMMHNL